MDERSSIVVTVCGYDRLERKMSMLEGLELGSLWVYVGLCIT